MGQEWLLRVELCGGTWVSWQKAVVSSWSRGGEQWEEGLVGPLGAESGNGGMEKGQLERVGGAVM